LIEPKYYGAISMIALFKCPMSAAREMNRSSQKDSTEQGIVRHINDRSL